MNPEQTRYFDLLELKAEAIGDSATTEQISRLEDWILRHIAPAYFEDAAELILSYGIAGELYTNIRMRMGEMGI